MQNSKLRRQKRTRGNIVSTESRPRLSVHRSNKHIAVQIIDDTKGVTLVGMTEKHVEGIKGTKTERAALLGEALAKKAVEKKISTVVFDKGSFRYHGRVRALAEGARKGGLVF